MNTIVRNWSYPEHGLNLDVYENIFSNNDCDLMFKTFDELFQRHKDRIKRTKDGALPHKRINLTYGNAGFVYTLTFKDRRNGGKIIIERPAIPWDDCRLMVEVRDRVASYLGLKLEFCVLQRYVDGTIWIQPHRDTEMPPGTTICGLSLGATRTLEMSRAGFENIRIPLPAGSMYVLRPPTNDVWKHCILKEPHVKDVRLSLTFRNSLT
jgi:alkylated DNA repair dioxygenase AlkB